MTDSGSLSADIFVDSQFSPEYEDLIIAALTALGVAARVKVLPRRRSSSDLQWLMLVALPAQAFLSSIGGKVANDAYKGFQNAVRKLLGRDQTAEPPVARPVVLQDTISGIRIILDQDLPIEGYQQLIHLDLSQFRLGPVHYDRMSKRWRSELDEATLPNVH
jgi:hypothetical protein